MIQKVDPYLIDSINANSVTEARYGLVGNNSTSNSQKLIDLIARINGAEVELLFPTGIYIINANVTIPANIVITMQKGAMFSVNTGVTLTCNCEIKAGFYQIFSGAGTVDKRLSPTPYNICWYEGVSLNKKWDKMAVNFTDKTQKTVIIPKTHKDQVGAILNNTTVQPRWSWLLDAPLIIDDNCSNIVIYCEGEIFVPTDIGTCVQIGTSANKIENIDFPLGICITADATARVGMGIEVRGCARLYFGGRIDINYADYPLILGGANQQAPVGEILFHDFHCGFPKYYAVTVDGTLPDVVYNVKFLNVVIDNATNTSMDCVLIKGNTRSIDFETIYYNTNTATYPRDLVVIQTTINGAPMQTILKNLYASNISRYALRTEDTSSTVIGKITNLFVDGIHCIGSTGIKLGYTYNSVIENFDVTLQITVDADAVYTQIHSCNRWRTLTDNSNNAVVNGVGTKALGVGVLPDTLAWAVGNIVVNTTDTKVYLKYRHTGVHADDFLLLN